MHPILAAVTALSLLVGSVPATTVLDTPKQSRVAEDIEHYWVYCIGAEVSVEMWDLEQMKVRRGSDVCQLHQSTSMSGAMEWMEKNFPTHKCSCQE
jgi:hypothetical protein